MPVICVVVVLPIGVFCCWDVGDVVIASVVVVVVVVVALSVGISA